MKKNRNKIANVCIAAGVICIIAALALAILNEYESREAFNSSQRVLEAMTDEIFQQEADADEADTMEGKADVSKYYELPVRVIEGNEYIGYLSFEDMHFPIMSSWDYDKLKKSACRYSGNLEEHNLVIAGHNYRSGFGKLKKLKKGDVVLFNAFNGLVYQYEVDEVEILNPTDIEDMTESQWDLSLYTCTYEGKARLTVRCRETGVFD